MVKMEETEVMEDEVVMVETAVTEATGYVSLLFFLFHYSLTSSIRPLLCVVVVVF
jgi:hypothetical protein